MTSPDVPGPNVPGPDVPGLDLLGIGNAIVDVLARCDDAFLHARGLDKGAMRLVDPPTAAALYAEMGAGVENSGGSAANTCAAAAALGARVGFVGKVATDALGEVFAHDLRAVGVRFATPPLAADAGEPTGRCLILVTPDGQRTMNTALGAAVRLGPEDIEAERARIEGAAILYLEGYLFDPPHAQAAFRRAAELARGAGRRVALTLSDPFCVGRHRDAFLALLPQVDILFANQAEATALFGTLGDADTVAAARAAVPWTALTRGADGSVIVTADGETPIAAAPVPGGVVDTTGAGDAYAAGALAALVRGAPPAECGRWAALVAAEAISHFGARPQADLQALVGLQVATGNPGIAAVLG